MTIIGQRKGSTGDRGVDWRLAGANRTLFILLSLSHL